MQEILIALIVSAAFPLGAILYYFTRDELVFKKLAESLRRTSYLCVVITSLITFALMYYERIEWTAAIFIFILIKSALTSIGLKGKPAMKRSLMNTFIFLIFFFALYLLI